MTISNKTFVVPPSGGIRRSFTLMSTYPKNHWGGILLDALWIAAAIGYGILVQIKWNGEMDYGWEDSIDAENHAMLFLARIGLIAIVTPFWAQLRLTPRLIALANRRRREEIAPTLIKSRDYLLRNMIRPYLPMPFLLLCFSFAFTALSMGNFEGLNDDLGFGFTIFIAVLLFCLPTALTISISMTNFLLLFRWLCRSREELAWHWLMSIICVVATIAMFVSILYFNVWLTDFEWNLYRSSSESNSQARFVVILLLDIAFFCYTARRLWRSCYLNYFEFD